MPRSLTALAVVVSLLLAGRVTGTPTASPDATAQTATDGETPSPTAADGEPVEYVVRAGEIPDEFESVTVTLQVVFAEDAADLGPCYPEVFEGPYKPTITPLATPRGDCHRTDPISVDLAAMDGERSLNRTGPASATSHALVLTDVSATHRNGTAVTAIRGSGGAELSESPDSPGGVHGVELGIGPAREDVDYDYWLLSESFDPSAVTPRPSNRRR